MEQRICTLPECEKPHRARGLCSMHWKQEYGKRTKYTITCIVCQEEHQSDRRDGKFCSDTCRSVDYRTRAWPTKPPRRWTRLSRLRSKLKKAARGTRGSRWVSGACFQCGAYFIAPDRGSHVARFCSNRCKRSDKATRHRARKKNVKVETYSRHKIFERDGWRCYICRLKVDRRAVVPAPLAPTLDHLVPLAEGGDDVAANVATAHFICNSIKRERGGGEQLAILG